MQSLSFAPRTVRRTTRIPCQVVRLRDFNLVADVIENVSPDGLLVGPADVVLTGEPVIVSFQLPGIRDYIDAEAVVARVVHGRRPGETRRGLGLELTAISPFSKLLLSAYLKRLPPIPPAYRHGFGRLGELARLAG
ncbi:MAG: PilZ domain-containing protein [Polyangiaceae bacterium]|nr:PilZ domain-containing protein [Polyangiaceae bacterium]MCE7890016.1 PilZ domain-containing protein [Sorangiineae bacterium PRO1]MCL4752211.1 PilZ domain-containing protein [Myxococcales bacterium]